MLEMRNEKLTLPNVSLAKYGIYYHIGLASVEKHLEQISMCLLHFQ